MSTIQITGKTLFTAAQAAQKRHVGQNDKTTGFTAAQAAQKFLGTTGFDVRGFTAAQAAQKERA